MRKILFSLMVMLIPLSYATAQCNYTVNLYDSFGDGWNGNTIDIEVAGTVTNYTLSSGSTTAISVLVNSGDSIKTSFQGGGSWISECSYDVVDASGITLYTSPNGGAMTAGAVQFADTAGCPAIVPPMINSTGVTSTTATIDFTLLGVANTIEVEYGTQGFLQGGGTIVSSTTSPIVITSLSPSTNYDFYYRATDGGTTQSAWAGPISLKTSCPAIGAYPWVEDFNGANWQASTTYDSCWSVTAPNFFRWQVNSGTTGSSSTGPNGDFTGSGKYLYTEASSSGGDALAQLPDADLTSLTQPELKFAYHMYGATINVLYIEVSTDTGATWTAIDSLVGQQQASSNDAWALRIVDLDSVNTALTQIRFRAVRGSSFTGDISIDEVTLRNTPACPDPTGFAAHNITSTTAGITFNVGTGASRIVEWGPTGFTSGTGTIVTSTTDTVDLSSLPAGTCIDVYIQGDCSASGDGVSTIQGPFQFCTAYVPDWLEDFNDHGTFSTWPPDGWDEKFGLLGDTLTTQGTGWTYDTYANQSGGSPSARENISSTFDPHVWIVGPPVDLDTGGTFNVEYDVSWTESFSSTLDAVIGSDDTVHIALSTDGGLTFPRSNILASYHQGNPINLAGKHEINTISTFTGVVHVGVYTRSDVSNESTDFFIDNIEIRVPPACQEPFGFAALQTFPDSIFYGFGADTSATGYIIEWGPCGYAQGTGMVDTLTTDTSGIGGLTAATCYDVYLQTICGAGSSSIWAGPFSFNTACDTLPIPWNESFESVTVPNLPQCWDWVTNGSTFYIQTVSGTSGTNPGSRSGSNYLRQRYSFNNNWWSFTPEFHFQAGQSYEVSFWYQTEGTTAFDEVALHYGPAQTAGDMIYLIKSENNVSATGYTQFVGTFIPPASGNYYVGLKTRTGGFSGAMNIDDFNIRLDPNPCPDASSLTATIISENEVDLTWGAISAHTSFDIEWGPQGFTAGTGQGRLVTGLTTPLLNIDTLSENTCYDYYVTVSCGGVTGTQVGPFTFCTPCSASPMPYLEDFNSWPLNCVDPAAGDFPWVSSNGWAEANYWTNNDASYIMDMRNVDVTVDARVKFKWSHQYNSSYPEDALTIRARVLGTTAWDTLWHITGAAFNSNDGAGLFNPGTGVNAVLPLDPATYTGNVVEFQVYGHSDWGPYAYVDDFLVEALPSCPEPFTLDFLNGSATPSAGTIYFTPGGASNFNIAYGPSATTGSPAAGTYTSATNDTVTISGLMPNTDYSVWVRDSCAAGDVSIWVGPITFRTACAAVTSFPYLETFDGNTWGVFTTYDPCWNVASTGSYTWQVDNNTTSSGSTGPTGDLTGTGNYLFTEASTGGTGDEAIIISPLMDVTSLTIPEMSIYYHFYGATIDRMYIEASSDGITWIPMDTIIGQQQTSSADAWQELTAVIPAGAVSTTTSIRFRGVRGTSFTGDMSIDQFSVREQPACPNPSNGGVVSTTATTADLYWTAGSAGSPGWVVEYGLNGFTLGSGTVVGVTNDTATISNLMPASGYCYYVSEICPGGADTSFISGPYCFSTQCPASFTAPYFTDLTVIPAGNSTSGNWENCWTVYNGSSNPRWESEDASGFNENSSSTGPFYDHTTPSSAGGIYIYLETSSPSSLGDTASIHSPWIDVSALNVPEFAFWYHMYGQTMGNLFVEAREWGTSSWTRLDSVMGQQQTAGSDPWQEQTVLLSQFTSDTLQVRFVGEAGSSFYSDMSIDDLELREAPTCPKINAVTFSNQTTSSADANWTATVTGQTYEIEYGPAGFAPGSGTVAAVTGTSYSFTGLPANLVQEMYIRPICGANDTGQWTGPFVVEILPIPCDDFEAYSLGLADPQSVFIEGWAGDGGDAEIVSQGGSQAMHIYDSGPDGFSDVVMQMDTITSGTHVLSFDFQLGAGVSDGGYYNILHNYTGATNVWAIEVYMDNNGTATVNQGTNGTGVIGTYTFNTTGWNRIEHVIDLDNDTAFIIVNGTTTTVGWQFSLGSINQADRFNAVNFYSAANAGQTPNYYVDNFCLCTIPGMVSSTNSTCTTVELDWMSSGSAIIQYGAAGFTPGTGTFITGATAPYTVTGLMPGTAYDFWIGEECNGDTLYNAPVSVTTPNGPKPTLNISDVQDTVTLTYADYILYSGATNADSVHWDFGGGVTMNGDTVMNTYGTNGSYTVTVYASNDCGDTTVTYNLNVQNISVEETALGRSLNVFPNPSTGVITLNFNLNTDEEVDVFILNGLGQRVIEESLGQVNSYEGQFDLSNLPKGVYIMQVQAGDVTVNRRVTLH